MTHALHSQHTFPPEGPEVTFPHEVALWVRDHYDLATNILEYGVGGSTAMASEMAGKTVFSVESSKSWVDAIQAWFVDHPPVADVHIHHEYIGKTKDWGHPVSHRQWHRFPRYSLAVWQREDFVAPDLVLIDGRFRVGCFLATLFSISKPTTVLFDDYVGREDKYQICETFAPIVETQGRMVKFQLDPTQIDPARLLDVVTAFSRPN
jgi:hypothetical protein